MTILAFPTSTYSSLSSMLSSILRLNEFCLQKSPIILTKSPASTQSWMAQRPLNVILKRIGHSTKPARIGCLYWSIGGLSFSSITAVKSGFL